MNLKELDDFKLNDAVHFHDILNPSLFENESDMMRPAVRKRLLTIAEDFIDHLGINVKVEDITLSGSNAAYSYTKHSDIDLHILVDMSKLPDNEVYLELFNAKKTIYNDTHDITIFGYDVELYVQDANEPVVSLGEYSVKNDKWIKLPRKRRANFDQASSQLKYNKLGHLIERGLQTKNLEQLENLISKIKKYRKAGLDKNGEFGPENLAYKALRSQGMIQKIYDAIEELHSEKLSLPENELLDKPEMSIVQLTKKHGVSKGHIQDQLSKGIKVEMEHTSKYDVAKEIALNHLAEDPDYYTKLAKVDLEEASGYIPSEKEKNDPRFKTALTVDVKPDTIQKNAKAFGFKVSRAGIPPLLRK